MPNGGSRHRFQIFTEAGEEIASFLHASDAGAFVAIIGEGSTIRYGFKDPVIVWHEGRETQPAGESYDFVAETILNRRYEQALG